jgi:hypothetical protein
MEQSMRTEQSYLDQVREKIKELQAFEERLTKALTKEYSEKEGREIWKEYLRLGFDNEEDAGDTLENTGDEEILKNAIENLKKQ